MQLKSAALLWSIVDYAEYILAKKAIITFDTYERDRDVRLAIERAFENIGEAARRLSASDPELAALISSVPTIIAFRNVIAHNYDDINNLRVWSTISDHLPVLVSEVRLLLPASPED